MLPKHAYHMPSFSVAHRPEYNRFEIAVGEDIALAAYEQAGGQLILTHTEVPPAHQQQGMGSALAEAALAYARQNELQVVPQCAFMAAYIQAHPEHQALVPEALRR